MSEPRSSSRSRSHYPSPDQVPNVPRRRASEERAALASSTRTATRVAVLAVLVAGVALGLTVWRMLSPAGSSPCQNTVWSAVPAANELPSNWSAQGTTFDTNRRTTQYVGVDPGDGSGPPNVLATATCFPEGASDAVARAQAAARQFGQVVTTKSDLSDGGFEATDTSGAIFLEFRRGDVVIDLAAANGATATDIETIASAYDMALGGDGGSIASPAPSSSQAPGASPSGSGAVGLTHDAPELEKLLPTSVNGVAMTVDSALGSAVLTNDPGGRAATAALRAEGKTPADLKFAESYDPTSSIDVSVIALSVNGLDAAKVDTMVLDWFQLSGAGVTKTDIQLGGKTWTKYDLGDEGSLTYVRLEGTAVVVITAADDTVAGQAASAMP